MIRISATSIEAFRRWLLKDDTDIEEMRDYLLRKIEPTEAMISGTLFHRAIENTGYGKYDGLMSGDQVFDFKKINENFELPWLREIKLEKDTIINGIQSTFVGVIDGYEFGVAYDHKLTGYFNIDTYLESYQWRCYLSWFDINKFCFNVFEKSEESNNDVVVIKDVHYLTMFRYPDINRDVMELTERFIDFVINYVPELINTS